MFGDESAELLGNQRNQTFLKERLEKSRISDLTLLGDDDPRRADMERRRTYVLEVIAQRPSKMTEETLQPIIDKVGNSRGEIDRAVYKKLSVKEGTRAKPSVSTVIRWVNVYTKAGEDERAFVPATKARGNRDRKFSGPRKVEDVAENISDAARAQMKIQAKRRAERVLEIIYEAIDEVYLNNQRFSIQDLYDTVVVKIADENEYRDFKDQLPVPNQSSIYNIVNKLDDREVVEARYGAKIAEEKYRASKLGPRPTRPLERTEADHTKTDLLVIDPVRMLPIGRPVLTWLICVYTKMILGFYISFNPYGSFAIMECLKHAIRPKTYVRDKYPGIKHEWPTYGVMETLVLDNAREFWGKHLEDACRQLGINIQYSQKGRAWYRPSVERSFRTFNTRLLHQQPGTTFSNIMDRADYDPQKNAIITPDLLDEITHKYIIDVQQYSLHRGIKDIPALRWEKGIQQWPPALPAKASDLDIVLGYIERRIINPYGIEVDTIIYNNEDLSLLRSQVKKSNKDRKFIIKRIPNDLSLIYVYDEKRDRYLPIPAIDQEYTKGLGMWQHSVIRKYVRERLRKNVDIVSLCRAKREIQKIVERDWNQVKTSRVKMARFRNEGIQDRGEILELCANSYTAKNVLNLPGPDQKPALMTPEAIELSRKGVSDLENAFNALGNTNKDKCGDNKLDISGFIDEDPILKNN